jgi:hypothetical protein
MEFDISRLRRADQIIAGGAIAFIIFLFLFKWYGGSASSSFGGVSLSNSLNGWDTFTNSRWIWLLTIIVALGAVVLVATQRKLELPIQPGVIVAGLGALSTALILYRIIHHPSGGVSGSIGGVHYSSSYGIKIGIWLGLIAAAVITYGGYLTMQAEGTSISDVREQAGDAFKGLTASGGGAAAGAAPGAGHAPPPPAAAESGPPIPPPAAPPGGEPPPPSQDA